MSTSKTVEKGTSCLAAAMDRAFHWMTASALNLIRWFCAVITVLVPGLYIALVTFHRIRFRAEAVIQ